MTDEVKPPEPDAPALASPPAPTVPAPPPPPPGPVAFSPQASRWRSVRGLQTALAWLLGLAAVGALAVGLALAKRLSVLNDIKNNGFTLDRIQKDSDAVDRVNSLNVAFLLVSLAVAVCLIVWMWRAAKNNQALGRTQPRLGPGWAIGGWFIPLANFVIPVLVVQDLWRGTDPSVPRGDIRWKIAPRSALVGWWWGLWVAGIVTRFSAGNSSNNVTRTLADARRNTTISLVSVLITSTAAVLAILVVRRISARQDECLRAQQAAWTAEHGGGSSSPA